MARSHQERAEEMREKADEYEAEIEALEALKEEVQTAERIGDTKLSSLFHEARTNRAGTWTKASAFVNIEDGEAVVEKVSKLREGRWAPRTRDRYDAVISVGVRPFMETDVFKSLVRDSLSQQIMGARSSYQNAQQRAEDLENIAECRQ